jgi:PleD family two-component response regulator
MTVYVSVGGSLARLDDTADTLFARADSALYDAKNADRNRTTIVSAARPARLDSAEA